MPTFRRLLSVRVIVDMAGRRVWDSSMLDTRVISVDFGRIGSVSGSEAFGDGCELGRENYGVEGLANQRRSIGVLRGSTLF